MNFGQLIQIYSIYFGSSQLGHTIKTNCMKVQAVNSEIILNFEF